MVGLPAQPDPTDEQPPADPTAPGANTPPVGAAPRPSLRVERGAPVDPASQLLDLGSGAVVETILRAARRHAAEAGSASEIRDLTRALERAVALLTPTLRQGLLQSLEQNYGLAGAGQGTAGHAWTTTVYGTRCEGCGFALDGSDPRLLQALAKTVCTGRYDDTAARARSLRR